MQDFWATYIKPTQASHVTLLHKRDYFVLPGSYEKAPADYSTLSSTQKQAGCPNKASRCPHTVIIVAGYTTKINNQQMPNKFKEIFDNTIRHETKVARKIPRYDV